MPTPTSKPENPDNSDETTERAEPIDPTRTVDAYFDKPATPETSENVEIDDEKPVFHKSTGGDPEPVVPDYGDPASAEPSTFENRYPEAGYGHPEPTTQPPAAQYPTAQYPTAQTTQAPGYAGTTAPEAFSSTTPAGHARFDDEESGPRAVRMRTVVLGLVLLVIAGAVLVGQLTDVTIDASAVLLALMIGGGILLIAGARRS